MTILDEMSAMINQAGKKETVLSFQQMNQIAEKEHEKMEKVKNKVFDYTSVNNGEELLSLLQDNGIEWARAFCQHIKKNLNLDIDLMIAFPWFANCIENSKKIQQYKS